MSKYCRKPILQMCDFLINVLINSLSDTVVHGRRLKRLLKHHSPFSQEQHMAMRHEFLLYPPGGHLLVL